MPSYIFSKYHAVLSTSNFIIMQLLPVCSCCQCHQYKFTFWRGGGRFLPDRFLYSNKKILWPQYFLLRGDCPPCPDRDQRCWYCHYCNYNCSTTTTTTTTSTTTTAENAILHISLSTMLCCPWATSSCASDISEVPDYSVLHSLSPSNHNHSRLHCQ